MILMLLLVIMAYRLMVISDNEDNAKLVAERPVALDILKGRYARGEIDKATYLAMRREVA